MIRLAEYPTTNDYDPEGQPAQSRSAPVAARPLPLTLTP